MIGYGRLSNVYASKCLPDPWVLNSRTHACPEENVDSLWIYYVSGYGIETLNLKCCELKL